MKHIKKTSITCIFGFLLITYFFLPGLMIFTGEQVIRMISKVSSHSLKTKRRTWHYLKGGDGELMVLVHGYSTSKDRWYPLIGFLTNHFTVIALDMPGSGETTFTNQDSFDILSQASNLHDFIIAAKINKFHILGTSMGGAITGVYAARHSNRIKSLVLINSYGIETKIKSYGEKKYATKAKKIFVYKDLKHQKIFSNIVFNKQIWIPNSIKHYFLNRRILKYNHYEKLFNHITKHGNNVLFPYLKHITANTLIIWGTEDRLFHYSAAYIIKNNIKHSKMVLIKNACHVPFFDKPKETIFALKQFYNNKK